jgi:hypothetical protein
MKFKQITYTEVCPISLEKIDKHLIKLYSSFVLLLLVLSLILNSGIGIFLITIDFSIRVFIGVKSSPLCIFLTKTLKFTEIKPVLVDSGRKKIAAQIGLLLSILISITYIFDLYIFNILFTSMFVFAIALDLIFDYCLACKIHSLFSKKI